jgi:predicted transcriptional regulator
MALSKTNQDVMNKEFATINRDASLKEAFGIMKRNMEGPPHSPGLVVVDKEGEYAGLLTLDNLMGELNRLYQEACDRPDAKDWADRFFNQCEIAGEKKISEIMSAKETTVTAKDVFDRSCSLVLSEKLPMMAVLEWPNKPVGVITRRMVLEELAPKMFK